MSFKDLLQKLPRPSLPRLDSGAVDFLRRGGFIALCDFVAVLLETSFFPKADLFGAVPDLVLILCLAFAAECDAAVGALAGLIGGTFAYLLGSTGVAYGVFLYTLLGMLAADLFRRVFGKTLAAWCILLGGAAFSKLILTLLLCLISGGGLRVLPSSLLPELAGTLILGVLFMKPFRALARVAARATDRGGGFR